MVFTKKDLEEIRRALAVMGVRDTDLPEAYPLTGNEEVAIVQDLQNRRVKIGEIFGKYLEGLLPYVGQGESAYQIAVRYGFEGTEQEWIESLNAAITIVENYGGGRGKAASAEDVKLLKLALDTLSGKALTKDDLKSYNVNDPTKPLSAKAGYDLWNMIKNLSPGSGVEIINNLTSTRTDAALSANMGRVLANMIEDIIALNNGIEKIYTWAEFQNLYQEPDDKTGLLANAKTVYNLWARLRNLQDRVAALEANSSGTIPGGDTDSIYRLEIRSANNITELNASDTTQLEAYYKQYNSTGEYLVKETKVTSACTWVVNGAPTASWVTVDSGLVTTNSQSATQFPVDITAVYSGLSATYQIRVRKVGGDDQSAIDPYIYLSPNSVKANSDGTFGASQADHIDVTVNIVTPDGTGALDWKFVDGQTFGAFDVVKEYDKIRISNIMPTRNPEDETTLGSVTVCINDSRYSNITATLSVKQSPVGYGNYDFSIKGVREDSSSHTFPAISDAYLVVVNSPREWVFEEKPEWITIYDGRTNEELSDEFVGRPGSTTYKLVCDSTTVTRGPVNIVAKYLDGSNYAYFSVTQDSTITDVIRLEGSDSYKTIWFTCDQNVGYSLILYASGNWTITLPDDQDWVKFRSRMNSDQFDYTVSTDGYTVTGGPTPFGGGRIEIMLDWNSGSTNRSARACAVLDDTDLKSYCWIIQSAVGEIDMVYMVDGAPVPSEGGDVSIAVRRIYSGTTERYPSWYILLDEEGAEMPDYVTFDQKYLTYSTDRSHTPGEYNVAQCYGQYDGVMNNIHIGPLPEDEESRDIEFRIRIGGQPIPGEHNYLSVIVHQEDIDAEEESESEEDPIVSNTLNAYIDSQSTVPVPNTGGTVVLKVDTTTGWDINNGDYSSGLTLSETSGEGGSVESVTVTVPSNSNGERTLFVTITSDDSNCNPATKRVEFKQAAAAVVDTYGTSLGDNPELVLGPESNASNSFTLWSSIPYRLERSGSFQNYAMRINGSNYSNGTSMPATTGVTVELITSNRVVDNTTYGTLKFIPANKPEINIKVTKLAQEVTADISPASGYYNNITIGPEAGASASVLLSIVPDGATVSVPSVSGLTITQGEESGKKKLTFSATAANTGDSDIVRQVTVSLRDYPGATCTFTITQIAIVLNVTHNSSTIPATGSSTVRTGSINVASNRPWQAEVTDGSGYITLSQYSSGGILTGEVLNYTFTENTGLTGRSGVIKVKITGTNKEATVNVSQAAFVPQISVNPALVNGSVSGGTGSFVVTSNVEWATVPAVGDTDEDGTEVTSISSNTVSYSYAENEASTIVDKIITVVGASPYNAYSATFVVRQPAASSEPYLNILTTTPINVSDVSGTGSFTVDTNLDASDWTATSNDTALSVDSISGNTVNYEYTQNLGAQRTLTITVSGEDVQSKTFTIIQAAVVIPTVNMSLSAASGSELPALCASYVNDGTNTYISNFYSRFAINCPSYQSLATNFTITIVEKITGVVSGQPAQYATRVTNDIAVGPTSSGGTVNSSWNFVTPILCDDPEDLLYSASVQFGSTNPYYTVFTSVSPIDKGAVETPMSIGDIKDTFGAGYADVTTDSLDPQ